MILGRNKKEHKLNWFMENLPVGFKENDSYKNAEGAGLLERLTDVICNEIDNEVLPKLENSIYLNDPMNITKIPNANYQGLLNYIGWLWGSVPYITFQDFNTYQLYLGYAVWIHKNRGNMTALNMFLALFDLEVVLTPPNYQSYRKGAYRYDNLQYYDSGIIYDFNQVYADGCTDCAKEYMKITLVPGGNFKVYDDEFREQLVKVIENYLTPINVELEIDFKLPRGIITRMERKIKTITQKLITSIGRTQNYKRDEQ